MIAPTATEAKPAVNEMEMHPHLQQTELFDYCLAHGIAPIAYSPIGSPGRPEEFRRLWRLVARANADVPSAELERHAEEMDFTPAGAGRA